MLKKHKQYKVQRDTPKESCRFEICENMHRLVVAVNSKLKRVDRKLPTNVNDLVNEFSCNIGSAECINYSCESCPKHQVNEDSFEEDVESSTDTDVPDSSKLETIPQKIING